MLTDAGCTVDTWETTYVHELTGEHPVLDWITGTALTPVKSALGEDDWQRFRSELIPPMLAERYPARPDGRTFFPFRRIFVVAQVASRPCTRSRRKQRLYRLGHRRDGAGRVVRHVEDDAADAWSNTLALICSAMASGATDCGALPTALRHVVESGLLVDDHGDERAGLQSGGGRDRRPRNAA